ncbi:hypothetical protein NS334_14980 [Sphingomonas endophytica]|uniref:Uncharacterized protein n=1 Tax=Sphingomonas endophytica TaxID=869719 RepID=A0A147HWG0_9SPHN|nr:hypothetical protein NS334_14980 [Sphingomonas endophytica]
MMVMVIVMVVTIGKVSREKWRAMAVQQSLPPQGPSAPATDEIRQLKERIAVLEHIITDQHGRADLDRQIEALRDR